MKNIRASRDMTEELYAKPLPCGRRWSGGSIVLFLLWTLLGGGMHAQMLREGYIDEERDVEFYISHVRPRTTFRDQATQAKTWLGEEQDKRLIMWMPCGTKPYNALPDGAFNRDVFSMWHYVTHYGNWSAGVARVPGAFSDVAHKNGVGVSCTAGIPYGELNDTWRQRLSDMTGYGQDVSNTDSLIEAKADSMAQVFRTMGIDGIGYNSEFSCEQALIEYLNRWHEALLRKMRQWNPLAQIIWYDGTSESGNITFDNGLYTHNDDMMGEGEHERSVLFLNYNWNSPALLQRSISHAASIRRSPLDLYCGFNLQGREPQEPNWQMLKDSPLSIGLWGAHNENMFYETRNEKGFTPLQQQMTYLQRQEMWFTNGHRQIADSLPVINSLRYDTDNTEFHGMSAMMSARSPLKWNLAEEPFVTCFNMGNGTFFNRRGEKASKNEWYNIGIQDHLPTWRWWTENATARLTWDDAFFGGSCLRIGADKEGEEGVVHLFKTYFETDGSGTLSVTVKSTAGYEDGDILPLLNDSIRLTFTGRKDAGNGWATLSTTLPKMLLRKISLITGQKELLIGKLAIEQGTATLPPRPQITAASLLARHDKGIDAKMQWAMPERYNEDNGTAMYCMYAQQRDGKVQFVGATTSWAGILFSIADTLSTHEVRLGVAALGNDMEKESEIAWTEWFTTDALPYYASQEKPVVEDEKKDVYPETAGHKPHISALTYAMAATGDGMEGTANATMDDGEGNVSSAITLGENGFGFRTADVEELYEDFFRHSFSIAFWIKINEYHADTQLLSIRDKSDYWPRNEWGWFWHTLKSDGTSAEMRLRRKATLEEDIYYELPDFRLTTGKWHELLYSFDIEGSSVEVNVYLDGEKMTVGNTATKNYLPSTLLGFRTNNVVEIGERTKTADGIDGAIDEVAIYDQSIASTKDMYPFATWTFEHDADAEGYFYSTPDPLPAFQHRYAAKEREGEGSIVVMTPGARQTGAPEARFRQMTVITTTQWSGGTDAGEGEIEFTECTDNSCAVRFTAPGTYFITMRAANLWGEDEYTLHGIRVGEEAGISTTTVAPDSQFILVDPSGKTVLENALQSNTRYVIKKRSGKAATK